MLRTMILLAAMTLSPAALADSPQVIFEEPFDGKLADHWQWINERPEAWRLKDGALEILIRGQQNFLVRDLPPRTEVPYAIEVTLTNLTPPTRQYEQAGFGWYVDDKQRFKFVKELIDGDVYVFPGKKPVEAATVQIRLIVSAEEVTAQYREDEKQEFQTAFSRPLPEAGQRDRISLMGYNGPDDAEHWIRFEDFRIVKWERPN